MEGINYPINNTKEQKIITVPKSYNKINIGDIVHIRSNGIINKITNTNYIACKEVVLDSKVLPKTNSYNDYDDDEIITLSNGDFLISNIIVDTKNPDRTDCYGFNRYRIVDNDINYIDRYVFSTDKLLDNGKQIKMINTYSDTFIIITTKHLIFAEYNPSTDTFTYTDKSSIQWSRIFDNKRTRITVSIDSNIIYYTNISGSNIEITTINYSDMNNLIVESGNHTITEATKFETLCFEKDLHIFVSNANQITLYTTRSVEYLDSDGTVNLSGNVENITKYYFGYVFVRCSYNSLSILAGYDLKPKKIPIPYVDKLFSVKKDFNLNGSTIIANMKFSENEETYGYLVELDNRDKYDINSKMIVGDITVGAPIKYVIYENFLIRYFEREIKYASLNVDPYYTPTGVVKSINGDTVDIIIEGEAETNVIRYPGYIVPKLGTYIANNKIEIAPISQRK